MNSSLILIPASLEHPSMDYAFLRQEGIRHLERMSGQLWTDFNAHDPGITILEQLCYALTDLSYRIAYDLPDLLADLGETPYHSLYSPAQMLPSEPVTLTDLRKLVIDVPGVKNAWIEKVDAQHDAQTAEPLYLKGLYRVFIETSDEHGSDNSVIDNSLVQNVLRRLHQHRNLCEDFDEILILKEQPVQIHARIETGPVEHPEDILFAIYQRIANYISPSIRRHTLSERLAAGKRMDEIFDGPLLQHGFIDTQELQQTPRRIDLRSSDLIREIMHVDGVQAVRMIRLTAGSNEAEWLLQLDPNSIPKLDLKGSKIELQRNQHTVLLDEQTKPAIRHRCKQQLKDSARSKPLERGASDLLPPPGQDRHVGRYYSIQHQFPAAYGIGEMGLPDSAPPQRQAQAKQLKAYLMFFDQLLANYFAQLAHVNELFAFTGTRPDTYFSQIIDDPQLGLEKISTVNPDDLQKITENPHTIECQDKPENPPTDCRKNTPPPTDWRRRNRFLNHLLARFAEQFTDYALGLYRTANVSATDESKRDKKAEDELVKDQKQAFLKDYPRMSSARGTAFNQLCRPETNISGLEQRLRLKLGITGNFFVVEHILLRPMSEDEAQTVLLMADARRKDPYSLQLTFVFLEGSTLFDEAFVKQMVREETPAHLMARFLWFNQNDMDDFADAYKDWLEKLGCSVLNAKPENKSVRDARNRVINLLRLH